MAKKKKSEKTMAEVSKGYEAFIRDKEITTNGKVLFNKILKTAVKRRGSK